MTLLKSYWDSIGGKPEPETKGKRKRQSASASAAPESSGRGRGRKRSRVDGESATPDAHQVIRGKPKWEIPKGSWEKVISSIDTLEEVRNPQDGKNQVFGLVVWENGQKSKYSLNTLKQKCPQKVSVSWPTTTRSLLTGSTIAHLILRATSVSVSLPLVLGYTNNVTGCSARMDLMKTTSRMPMETIGSTKELCSRARKFESFNGRGSIP